MFRHPVQALDSRFARKVLASHPTCVGSPIKFSEYRGKIYLAGSEFTTSRHVGYPDMNSVWKTHAHTFNQISLAALQMKEVNHDSQVVTIPPYRHFLAGN
jgi:hypothetical protein